MRSRILVLATLAAAACTARAPAPAESTLVTLGTFEGEMDPVAGTFSVRSTGLPASSAGPGAALVIPEGTTGVTIANNGTPTQGAGTGTCADFTVLSAPVRITLGASNTGFAGGLYAEVLTITGTGGEACNSVAPPAGLSATKGLWSYGTVRSGATTSDATWNMKVTSGQRTTFTGRIVGIAGTTFTTTAAANPISWNTSYSPIIAYTRASTGGAEGVAYASVQSAGAGHVYFLGLDGTALQNVTLPADSTGASSLAAHVAADPADDLLWFTSRSYVGVIRAGVVTSLSSAVISNPWERIPYDFHSVTVDPGTPGRAWFVSRNDTWVYSVDYNFTTGELSQGAASFDVGTVPYSVVVAPATAPATGNWVYVSSNADVVAEDRVQAWDTGGTFQNGLTLPVWAEKPYTLIRGSGGTIWFTGCNYAGDFNCAGIRYDPASGAFTRWPVSSSSGALAVARATTGAGDVVWAFNAFAGYNPDENPIVHQAVQLVQGATCVANPIVGRPAICNEFAVDLPDSMAWDQSVPSLAGSPAVGAHPAYLWWTSDRAIYRLQPQ